MKIWWEFKLARLANFNKWPYHTVVLPTIKELVALNLVDYYDSPNRQVKFHVNFS